MMRKFGGLSGLVLWIGLSAFDANPSKDSNRLQPYVPGKRFDIFAGDPERVRRVNEIRREDFQVSAIIEPSPVILENDQSLPTIKAGIVVISQAKRPKTLSFPDAQRVEVVFREKKGKEVYRWSTGKRFIQAIGTSMVMPGERLVFWVDVPLSRWKEKPQAGTYQMEAVLANYSDFVASTNWVMKSG
ncbi:MAG: hypothetical protein K1X66_00180 [Verrucomicrobiae bacterium]|nr:hypothetical protein [Verrucomicrobiae bacterium]